MGCGMSRLLKATVALVILVLLFMPGAMAAAAASFDAFPGTAAAPAARRSARARERRLRRSGPRPLQRRLRRPHPEVEWAQARLDNIRLRTRLRHRNVHHIQKTGDLYVADAYKGLMRVPPGGGEATVLVDQIDGMPLRFTNGVDVDQVTGQVYFTHSSMNYDRSEHEMVTKTGDSTGRLMMYDPRTSDATVLQPRMTYPNGVALSADRTHLVVASTGPCKLLRHWIKGVDAGKSEPFADLPGYPDNVRPDRKGGYWVALHRERNELPFGRDSHLLAVRVAADGKIVEEMRGPKKVRPTEIMERDDGKLYLGSVELPYVGVQTIYFLLHFNVGRDTDVVYCYGLERCKLEETDVGHVDGADPQRPVPLHHLTHRGVTEPAQRHGHRAALGISGDGDPDGAHGVCHGVGATAAVIIREDKGHFLAAQCKYITHAADVTREATAM
uniref:Strictosidine synthase 1 n=1 Tax=Aegilops tauschii TaxID=37682 RepID=M8D4U6_AEGTA